MKTYKTNQIAKIIGIHVNTVRLYEKCKLISKPIRIQNGYRVFDDIHIEQFKLARAALKAEVLQNGLRLQAVEIIKASALFDIEEAKFRAQQYLQQVEQEIIYAEEAIEVAGHKLTGFLANLKPQEQERTRKEAADYLHITVDTLRNWELNGLLTVKRRKNGYRIYTHDDLKRLEIIRSLRYANYSLAAILRMLHSLSLNPIADVRTAIDTPPIDDDVITACDKLLTALHEAKINMLYVTEQIEKIEVLKYKKH